MNLRLLEVVLGREGFSVTSVADSRLAFDQALELEPSLILLDVMMPALSGLEVLAQLQAHDQTRDIPVLMVTARTQGEDVKGALEAGAFDYVKKPLDEVEIVARVRSALRYKARQDELVRMAMRDSLTGLYNHRLLIELLERELAAGARNGQPVSFAMVDLDRFKQINDRWGHQTGDLVLTETARVLTGVLRRSDPVGRYGGEEFGVVLAGGCLPAQAEQLCERLRARIEAHPFEGTEGPFRVTASLGLAHWEPGSNEPAARLIRRADEALYRAKETGRNRLEVSGPRS